MNKLFAVVLVIASLVVVIIAAGAYLLTKPTSSLIPVTLPDSKVESTVLPGLQTGIAPWKAEIDGLKQRLNAIGLPALKIEGEELHTHQHLDLYVHGKRVEVPENIGVNDAENFISPIHSHDTADIIHIESPTAQTFTLGQFFDIWGVRLTKECIGGYCADENNSLKLYSNGKEVAGNFRSLPLEEHQEIAITYGTGDEEPKIPTSFKFPEGY